MEIRKMIRALVLLITIFTVTPIFASTIDLYIYDQLIVPTVVPFEHDGTILVPLRIVSENLGAKVDWDSKTKKIAIEQGEKTIVLTVDNKEAIVNGKSEALAAAPQVKNSTTMVPVRFVSEHLNYNVNWDKDTQAVSVTVPVEIGQDEVGPDEIEQDEIEVIYEKQELPKISNNGKSQIIKISARPEKGFYWPYYLVIPSNQYVEQNKGYKKYLMIETINCGSTNSLEEIEQQGYQTVSKGGPQGLHIAEKLNTPFILPAFPRPNVGFYDVEEGDNFLYTHALDRDTAILHLRLKNLNQGKQLREQFNKLGLNSSTFEHLDRQVIAMADDAVEYLNQNNLGIEEDKFFVYGYSASGTFSDRLAALQPNRIKAVASGAILDDMFLPLKQYSEENLIFPLGAADYEEITGRVFDIAAFNNVARLAFMGKDDNNDTLPYGDSYGDAERDIVTRLFGTKILPRAKKLTELYGEAGGKGILILDKNIKHSTSSQMNDYVFEFFKENRNNRTPVYPMVKATSQLEAVCYE